MLSFQADSRLYLHLPFHIKVDQKVRRGWSSAELTEETRDLSAVVGRVVHEMLHQAAEGIFPGLVFRDAIRFVDRGGTTGDKCNRVSFGLRAWWPIITTPLNKVEFKSASGGHFSRAKVGHS